MDIEAAYEGDPAALNREEVILSYPFVEAIVPPYSLVFYEEKQLRILDKKKRQPEPALEWFI
jgi:hypothetical protein